MQRGWTDKNRNAVFNPIFTLLANSVMGPASKMKLYEVTYKNKNIAEILKMTFDEAADFFKNI